MDWVNTKIKALRKAKGLSQEQMAEKLSVQQATYSSWETGKVDLTIGNIERIAAALEVDLKAIWDPDQFEKKDWKPRIRIEDLTNEDIGLLHESFYKKSKDYTEKIISLGDISIALGTNEKASSYTNLNDKDAMIRALQEEVAYLRQVNKALATSLNQLNEKKS